MVEYTSQFVSYSLVVLVLFLIRLILSISTNIHYTIQYCILDITNNKILPYGTAIIMYSYVGDVNLAQLIKCRMVHYDEGQEYRDNKVYLFL